MNQLVLTTFALCAVTLTLFPAGGFCENPRPEKPAGLISVIIGNSEDKAVELTDGPVAILMGGGPEVDRAFEKYAYPTIKGGDIVVLRTDKIGGYNPYLYEQIVKGELQPDSVETIQLDTQEQANSDYAAWAIETAEMVWIAGGDQSAYLAAWRGTRSQEALQKVWNKGGVLGGTSAGLAVLGEFVYDPGATEAAISTESIANPYNKGTTISDRFLDIPWLDNTITETHFRNRDRMGRTLGFMAILRQDERTPQIRALCISEDSCITITKDGIGHVDAQQDVFILQEDIDTKRTQVAIEKPLVYGPVSRIKLKDGDLFNFRTWTALKPALQVSVDGTKPEKISPANYYDDVEDSGTDSSVSLSSKAVGLGDN